MSRTQVCLACADQITSNIHDHIPSYTKPSAMNNIQSPLIKIFPTHVQTHTRTGDMVDGMVYPNYPDVSPELYRKTVKDADTDKGKKRGSVLQKFGSLRLTRKKGSTKPSLDPAEQAQFVRETNRQSLPSHFRRQVRPGLSSDTFVHPHDPHGFNRAISLSSGEGRGR